MDPHLASPCQGEGRIGDGALSRASAALLLPLPVGGWVGGAAERLVIDPHLASHSTIGLVA